MKKFIIVVLLAGTFVLYAQEVSVGQQRFTADLNLQQDISSLANLADKGGANISALQSQTFFLDGVIGAIVAETEEPYQLIVELLAGEWIGTKALVLHRIFLLLDDPMYDDFFRDTEGQQASLFAYQPVLVEAENGQPIMLLRIRSLLLEK